MQTTESQGQESNAISCVLRQQCAYWGTALCHCWEIHCWFMSTYRYYTCRAQLQSNSQIHSFTVLKVRRPIYISFEKVKKKKKMECSHWMKRFTLNRKILCHMRKRFIRWVMTWRNMFNIYIMYENICAFTFMHKYIMLNEHTNPIQCVWYVCSLVDEGAGTATKLTDKSCWREILRELWWMSWLQFTTCKHALPTCHISNPLAII